MGPEEQETSANVWIIFQFDYVSRSFFTLEGITLILVRQSDKQ
jgi:hypothetical protein